jgi:DNA-binding transcriptional ArsR family regulator
LNNYSTVKRRRELKNNKNIRCDCAPHHQDIVDKARASLPREERMLDLSELFKVLGDATRIKIISALLTQEMCVCDIAVLLDMTKSAISHQLRVLRQSKLVKARKQGKHTYYSLDDDHVQSIIETGLAHINE